MSPIRICRLAAPVAPDAIRRVTAGFVCVLLAAMCLPAHVAAQADPPAGQQQDAQAQRDDLAAELDALKREIEDIKVQLARITALQRAQGEQLLRQQAPASELPAPAAPIPVAPQTRPTRQRPVATPTPPAATASPGEGGTPTVFIFKDGSRTEGQNYAIVGGTLWIYTDQEAKKYAVSYIDVPATTAANAARGGKFQMPDSR